MKILPKRIDAECFKPFGDVYNLKDGTEGVSLFKSPTFTDRMIELPPFGSAKLHIGMTEGTATPCPIHSMEIHPTTEEVLLCTSDPVILCVAPFDGTNQPKADEIQAFEMHSGEVAVLRRDIWHDACHGIGKTASYCWLARACETGVGWVDVQGTALLE